MYSVTIDTAQRQITVWRGDNPERARRVAYSRRHAHPRATTVTAWAPNGVRLLALGRRG